MDILLVADGHYYIDSNNQVYVESVFDYSFYARYLEIFDNVNAIIRAEHVVEVNPNWKIASGSNVNFLCVPPSRGVKSYIKNFIITRKLIKSYVKQFSIVVLRVPGTLSNMAFSLINRKKQKIALEVVVDPWEYFAKGTIKGISRPIVRFVWTIRLKYMCMRARGVSYVTEFYLQKRYPCRSIKYLQNHEYFDGHYSSVELIDDMFGTPRKCIRKESYTISHVANSFTSYGKGHIILMDAVKKVQDNGYDVNVIFVGDGPLKGEFIEYAESIGIMNQVSFIGRLPNGDAVREVIKQSDLFVFPTRAEGLPRVVLEAMAEGLPVISSPVCGIPEILEEEFLIKYSDYAGYADAIIRMIETPDLMSRCSYNNIQVALKYRKSELSTRRNGFYSQLLE